ncbi:MAG: APC family permease [Thermoprotei archaeon]
MATGESHEIAQMPTLKKGLLGLKEAYGQAMGVTAPLGSVVSTTTAAIIFAGAAVPLATVIAFLGSVIWIWILTRYSRKVASPGGYYSFSGVAYMSRQLSMFEALTEVFAYVFLNAFDAVAVYLLLQVAGGFLGIKIPLIFDALAMLMTVLYPTLVSLANVKTLMGKIVTIGSTLEVVLLLGFFAFVTYSHGFTLQPFNPSMSTLGLGGLATAFILSLVSISGAGTATYLGEETKIPTKTISKGMWLALLIGGISMILGTYALVVGWGLGHLSTISSSPQPLFQEIGVLGVPALIITIVLSVNSILVQNIGATVSAARILFNLSREESAPALFKNVSSRGQPTIATLFVGALTGAITFGAVFGLGVEYAFASLSIPLSVLWVLGRTIDTAGVPLFYKRIGKLTLPLLLVPLVMFMLNIWGIAETFYPPSIVASSFLVGFLMVAMIWYRIWGTTGKAGSLVVTESGEVISAKTLIDKLRTWPTAEADLS